MSSFFTVRAIDFKGFLEILSQTTYNKKGEVTPYHSIYLFTKQTDFGDEVGASTFLFGASYNLSVAGSTGIPVDGVLSQPWCMPSAARQELIAMLTSWIREDKEALVKVHISEHGASSATLVDSEDRRVNFLMHDAEDWPVDEAYNLLTGQAAKDEKQNKDGLDIPTGKRLKVSHDILKTLATVAKRTEGAISFLPVSHMASVVLVECGDWRGAFLPEEYAPDTDVNSPEVDLIDPRDDSEGASEQTDTGVAADDSVEGEE